MNSRIRGVEDCDLLLLVGTNPREEAPVLNARIRKSFLEHNLKVGVVGSSASLTYDFEHLGNTVQTLVDIFNGTHPFCAKIANVINKN